MTRKFKLNKSVDVPFFFCGSKPFCCIKAYVMFCHKDAKNDKQTIAEVSDKPIKGGRFVYVCKPYSVVRWSKKKEGLTDFGDYSVFTEELQSTLKGFLKGGKVTKLYFKFHKVLDTRPSIS